MRIPQGFVPGVPAHPDPLQERRWAMAAYLTWLLFILVVGGCVLLFLGCLLLHCVTG